MSKQPQNCEGIQSPNSQQDQSLTIDPKLQYNQNGFRENRSMVALILALGRIIEDARNNSLSTVTNFLDFKKSLTSYIQEKCSECIPPQIVRAIETTITGTTAKHLDDKSEACEIHAGVLQGDKPAPFLLITVLEGTRACICGLGLGGQLF